MEGGATEIVLFVRVHGCISSAGGLGLRDHACWTYEDDGLELMDHHGMMALADHARMPASGSSGLVSHDAPPQVARIGRILEIAV